MALSDRFVRCSYLCSDEPMCGNKPAEIFGWCVVEGNRCSRCGEETIQRDVDCSERNEEEYRLIKSKYNEHDNS